MDADWILIHKIRTGDEAAIDAFVRKYYQPILKYCFYKTSDEMIAEDLTQETFYHFLNRSLHISIKGNWLIIFIL